MITLIAAADEHNALGKGSDLLWHLPEDFKHFKRLTTGHCIIMGRKTFETFPKPLPNRTHIVITRQKDYIKEGIIVVNSLEEAIEKALEDQELYKPMVRMAGLCRWLDVSTTTIVKWQREGMPHMVIDGVTLYDKHKVSKWLQQYER